MKFIYLFGLISVLSCNQKKSDNKTSNESPFTRNTELNVDSTSSEMKRSIIGGSIGVVSVTDNITEKDTIRLFDKDGKLWYKFSFFYDDSNGKFDYPNENFDPLSFHPDNFLLMMEVADASKNRYEVKVNQKNNLTKYLEKNQDFLLFQSWEEHIISTPFVSFNESTNPILQKPSGNPIDSHYNKDGFFQPVEINGDWLQIKWGSGSSWEYGWIRWKKGDKLQIDLDYLA